MYGAAGFILTKSETFTVTLENGENGNSKICDTGVKVGGRCLLLYRMNIFHEENPKYKNHGIRTL